MAAPIDASPANEDTGGRSPCVPIAAALAAGIAIEHACPLPRFALYGAAALLLATLYVGRKARREVRVAALIALYGVLGAAVHQAAWRDRGPDSVTRLLAGEPKLVRLTGILAEAPVIERRREAGRRAAWQLDDRTRVPVDAKMIASEGAAPRRVTGRVQVTAAGHLIHVGIGDRVEVAGWLVRPSGPRNPCGFDPAEFLRNRGIDATLYVDHPDAVRRLDAGRADWRRRMAHTRERLSARFAEHLSVTNGAVGTAMILGDRSAMPLDVRDAYVASGAMHILAISGLNVGILAAFLVGIGRLMNLSSAVITVAVVGCAWAYAVLTNLEPPVVRASIFLTLWAVAALLLRRASLLNTAAATTVVLLLHDPPLLFDVGARLSFLAVLGMSWSLRCLPRARPLFVDITGERQWPARAARWVAAAQVLALGIWMFTAPLIAAEFQIVSPVGLLLNVILVPLATAVMWTGYAFFGVCLMAPWAAGPFGALFDLGLSAVNGLVAAAGGWDLGHVSIPAVPPWWTVGCYGLLFLGLLRPRWAGRRARSLAAVLVWAAIGLGIGALPTSRPAEGLRMTALDVGHGGAVLIETPHGRRLLFDCGSMEDDRRAAESVWRAVRQRGGSAVDLLVVSHADLDHCNNVPALLRGGRVATVAVARSFLDLDQPSVKSACDAAREAGTPTRLLAAGDEIRLDPSVAMAVVHPPDRPPGEDDNANSVVLRIEYAGRSILLTGDLEGSGQEELFDSEPAVVHDVVVAPHHGGLKANTPEFAAWSRPRAVIVSSGDRVDSAALREVYQQTPRLYLTPRHGAVTVRIAADGGIFFDVSTGAE